MKSFGTTMATCVALILIYVNALSCKTRMLHIVTYNAVIIRPPGTAVPDGLMFYCRCFFLFRHAFSEFPRPIALKLCHMDCIVHNTLITRLEHTFGFSGAVLSWIKSYLDSRSAVVKFGTFLSDIISLESGVPQGSSLGPALFSLYIAPLSRVITSFGVSHHQYADDTQLYISVAKSELSTKADTIESCICAIHDWLMHNGLSLNPAKSEVTQFSTRRSTVNKLQSLSVSGTPVQCATSINSQKSWCHSRPTLVSRSAY